MEKKTLKVVMICHFSNSLVRKHIKYSCGLLESIIRFVLRRPLLQYDFNQWNTNAIKEFEKKENEVELHVISPCYGMSKRDSIFCENGVHYYFFKDEFNLFTLFKNEIFKYHNDSFLKNREYISKTIASIKPDIIHIIGAENPSYSMAAFDIPENIPYIVQLQTLMLDPEFKNAYPINSKTYEYRSCIEKNILEKADYIGTRAEKYKKILTSLSLKHPILGTTLALTEPIDLNKEKKEFDFVYFAFDISKAVDYAIEAFAMAFKEKPTITLDIVGAYSVQLKKQLDNRISKLGIQNNVFFEGKLATHDDVIRQITKSRFALLPLKIDLISGTIRESMANGLPVITTITPDTPKLNEKRESVLLSPIGDHQAMAENMLKLLNDEGYAETLRKNAGITASERINNERIIRKWIDAYHACIDNFKNGTPIPEHLLQ